MSARIAHPIAKILPVPTVDSTAGGEAGRRSSAASRTSSGAAIGSGSLPSGGGGLSDLEAKAVQEPLSVFKDERVALERLLAPDRHGDDRREAVAVGFDRARALPVDRHDN